MKKEAVEKITRTVVRQFPEMDGVRPAVKSEEGLRYLVTFKGTAELPNGKSMKRIVRVVADEKGDVIRMSTSR
ncbi:MAG: hypothetical protein BMS9Abin28_1755 [Anaerolineae bacterium]|nr:MAG: hypothetical protein BMS9Abin28_1755 [Anaerolineae bacterium]